MPHTLDVPGTGAVKLTAALGICLERPLFAVEGQRLRIPSRIGTQDPDNS